LVEDYVIDDASERACIELFKRLDYGECAEQVLGLLAQERATTHTLMQLAIISFQRIGYVAGIEDFSRVALDVTTRDPWHRSLLELTLGRKALPEILPLADSPRKRCQVHYYAGAKFATEKRMSQARDQFTRAAQHEAPCVELELAHHELAMSSTKQAHTS
jgi:hypothetical protein